MMSNQGWSQQNYVEVLRIRSLLKSMEKERELLLKDPDSHLLDPVKISKDLIKKTFKANPIFSFFE